jgi:YfiH family protein
MTFIKPDWPAPANIKAYSTVRTGWSPEYPLRTCDKYSLQTLFQLPNEPVWITQTHSTIAIEAIPQNKEQEADATFTNQPNHICVVLTADCMPILICNRSGTHVAAIHAGWRGLANGIISNTINVLGQPTNELMVWLGPTIGPKKFEVGKDVYDAFTNNHPESAKAFAPHQQDKWLADLYILAKIRLASHGISKIYGGNFCTYTQNDLFFSYRRDKGRTGSMASLIWIAG